MEYGILKFTSKYRVQNTGIPFRGIGSSSVRIVNVKRLKGCDVWAKVDSDKGKLVEILGPVGDCKTEQHALALHHRILPVSYPTFADAMPSPCDPVSTHIAITVDGPTTSDMDDAISLETNPITGNLMLGIHITDTTFLTRELFDWSKDRVSSAYPCDGRAVHMLPNNLCSLVKGGVYNCISLLIEVDKVSLSVVSMRDCLTRVMISDNIIYDDFGGAICELLRELSKEGQPEDQVAWAMKTYNMHFASILSEAGILFRSRVHDAADAEYTFDRRLTHCDFNGALYTHMTSPMRRFPDMYNQRVYKGKFIDGNERVDVDKLNAGMKRIARYHYSDAVMYLAYKYKESPLMATARNVREEGDGVLVIVHEGRRIRIPVCDSFYAEPMCEQLREPGLHEIEIFGIIKDGRAQLRVKMAMNHQNGNSSFRPRSNEEHVDVDLGDTTPMRILPCESARTRTTIDDASDRMKSLLGYPLDAFQLKALEVVMSGDDLLGMAPTGSGKTVLALLGIALRAFDQGKRAIFTSPIKALSNQKFAEFNEWLSERMGERRVSLLTGDIQSRATPPGGDGGPELLIMTNEILSNKLEIEGGNDPDLKDVVVVVMDEVHYINDPDRGASWEKALMLLPKHVQIIALSATLKSPELFCDWMSERAQTRVIQRYDRHVPLHVGMYDVTNEFTEIYSTHGRSKSMESAAYDHLIKRRPPYVSAANLVSLLKKDEKLPAIVFVFSRERCIHLATTIKENLLIGPRPVKGKDQDEYDYEWQMEQHMEVAQDVRRRQEAMYQRYLVKHKEVVEAIPGFDQFKALLDNGVGYHHAGMLPILREYVELLFQNKLLKVIFATETLGVGLNMPARTVVFTAIEKPNGLDTKRALRPDEFWQMAGRAGRRGMDTHGFVVYYPLKEPASSLEVQEIMCGQMPSVRSQLVIDPITVLRTLNRKDGDNDNSSMAKTLLSFQNIKAVTELENMLASVPTYDELTMNDINEYQRLKRRTDHRDGFIRLTPKQHKDALAQQTKLMQKYGPDFERLKEDVSKRLSIEAEVDALTRDIQRQYACSLTQLENNGLVHKDGALTPKGSVCAIMVEGRPLDRGSLLYEGCLNDASMEDIITWLSGFTENINIPVQKRDELEDQEPFSCYELSRKTYEMFGYENYNWDTACLMKRWLETKDVRVIAGFLGIENLGVFVRIVLRTINFIQETEKSLLGLMMYKIYNRLENYRDALLSGVVSNMSLYVV